MLMLNVFSTTSSYVTGQDLLQRFSFHETPRIGAADGAPISTTTTFERVCAADFRVMPYVEDNAGLHDLALFLFNLSAGGH